MLPKYLLLSCFFLLHGLNAFAQPTIALEHDGTSTFFTDIPSAVNAAMSGDTIYLPGGNFPGFTIDKKLTIIGAGHDLGSTVATTRSIISGSILLYGVICSGTIISGLRISGTISNEGPVIDNIKILRCFVSLNINVNQNNGSDYWTISESIVGGINYISFNSLVTNNLIRGYIFGYGGLIENNVFLTEGTYPISTNTGVIKNNIFRYFPPNFNDNCTFYNNIWASGSIPNGIFGNGNIGIGNINDTNFDALFTNFSYATYAQNMDNLYQFDFHLANPAYNTGGTDGAPIGIYGGLFPWKAGSVPFNPHIESKQIGSTTDPSGNLNVNIQVKAQDN